MNRCHVTSLIPVLINVHRDEMEWDEMLQYKYKYKDTITHHPPIYGHTVIIPHGILVLFYDLRHTNATNLVR